eukprot:4470159-Pleurochrysis_carterae.AAC.2
MRDASKYRHTHVSVNLARRESACSHGHMNRRKQSGKSAFPSHLFETNATPPIKRSRTVEHSAAHNHQIRDSGIMHGQERGALSSSSHRPNRIRVFDLKRSSQVRLREGRGDARRNAVVPPCFVNHGLRKGCVVPTPAERYLDAPPKQLRWRPPPSPRVEAPSRVCFAADAT